MIEKLEKIKLNDIVYISDKQSLLDNNTVEKLGYSVHTIAKFVIPTAHVKINYKILTLVSIKPDSSIVYLILNQSGRDSEVGLYFPVNLFPQGSDRKEILDGNEWLFENPGKDKYVPSELAFTKLIEMGDVSYKQKFLPISGEYKENYTITPTFCTLTEYHSDNDIPNKDVILFEIGGMDKELNLLDNGGSIHLMHGRPLAANDLEILLK